MNKVVYDLGAALDKFMYEKPVLTKEENATLLPMLVTAIQFAQEQIPRQLGQKDCGSCEYDSHCSGGL